MPNHILSLIGFPYHLGDSDGDGIPNWQDSYHDYVTVTPSGLIIEHTEQGVHIIGLSDGLDDDGGPPAPITLPDDGLNYEDVLSYADDMITFEGVGDAAEDKEGVEVSAEAETADMPMASAAAFSDAVAQVQDVMVQDVSVDFMG